MLNFIPAWYFNDQWCENEQAWIVRRTQSEFDDSVKQIQLFHRNGLQEYTILLLSFAPNFRHFLHRQGVYRAPYWSCFDSIQEIRRKKASIFSFHDLNWPDGIEFLYNPFEVIAMYNNQKYACIVFGEYGNMIYVNMFRDGMIVRKNIYDDRGFVASTIVYENEKMLYQDYLMENGTWKIRFFYSDGHVEVNHDTAHYILSVKGEEKEFEFLSVYYENMETILEEVFSKYLEYAEGNDIYCVAMHKLHLEIMERTMNGRNVILSFFKERYPLTELDRAENIVEMSDYVVTDSRESRTAITYRMRHVLRNITDISPFDTRVEIGISQQLAVQKILVPVDGLDDEVFVQSVVVLGDYLKTNKYSQVHIFTRNIYYKYPSDMLNRICKILDENGIDKNWAIPIEERETFELDDVDEETVEVVPQRFFVEQCVSEIEVSKCFREQRLLVDMREIPEMYLQISAISVCIPQIVRKRTQFIENGKNGIILNDIDELYSALEFYLNGLANWNESAVNSYEIGKRFSTRVLINKWKGVIRSIG